MSECSAKHWEPGFGSCIGGGCVHNRSVSSPDPERVREAVEWARQFRPGPNGNYSLLLLEAAEAWLAGSSPDYEAAARQLLALADVGHTIGTLTLHDVRLIVDAAFPSREVDGV